MADLTAVTAPRKGMSPDEITQAVRVAIESATLEEKVAMLSGRGFFKQYMASGKRWGADPYQAGSGCERLGIPALYFTDGPRGVARGASTCFPCTMARGASFDIDLERAIGEVMGIEARAQGCTLSGAVCVNLLRHPAWGRAQETYGEDSHHLGEMGAALAQGIQTHNVIATVKHFALNSMENARFKVDVLCDDRTMREVYLPHFKRILDAGCASVMSAYNKWNGAYCGENATLLTNILRDEWGFDGFVHSDWVMGVYDVQGVVAGLDIENPEPRVFGRNLVAAVREGKIAQDVVDTACARILRTQYRFAAAPDPLPAYTLDYVACAEHRALAKVAAQKSAVLLKNDAVLPFNRKDVRTLAVLGRLATLENTGDFGSSRVQPPYVITALQGLQAALGDGNVRTGDETDLAAARSSARAADAVVVVVGYTAAEEGEFIPGDGIDLGQNTGGQSQFMTRKSVGGDRRSLDLPADQVALILAAAESGKPTVVVVIAGSAVMVEAWHESVGAILQTFYAGMEGGAALADLLFGAVSPSARLPFTVAREESDYPFLDIDADAITYGPLAGYTHFDAHGATPRYAFGHGLSYARFAASDLDIQHTDDLILITLMLENCAAIAAECVALGFVHPPQGRVQRPVRQLKAFERIALQAGERRSLTLTMRKQDLMVWDTDTRAWAFEHGDYSFSVSMPDETLTATLAL